MPPKTTNRLIFVDFDETLAEYDHWRGPDVTGEPIPEMVEKVKQAMANGDKIVIFSARVNPGDGNYEDSLSATRSLLAIAQWCQQIFGMLLPITHEKSRHVDEIWDDRARQVLPNAGVFANDLLGQLNGDENTR